MQGNVLENSIIETEANTVTVNTLEARQWCYLQCIYKPLSMEERIIEARKLEMYILGKDGGSNPNATPSST